MVLGISENPNSKPQLFAWNTEYKWVVRRGRLYVSALLGLEKYQYIMIIFLPVTYSNWLRFRGISYYISKNDINYIMYVLVALQ